MRGMSVGPKLMRFGRLGLFPVRAGWALANRAELLPRPQVGSLPHLDPEALRRWRIAIAETNVYLEYGSGGSTVAASATASHVVSVESDQRFLAAVEGKVRGSVESRAALHPIYVDIGWTEKWGRPLFTWPTRATLAKWRRYPSAPWDLLDKLQMVPEFIFVDGRFRTASVLESFRRLPANSDCLFMLDDFEQRQETYRAILAFANNVERAGRAILFRRNRDFDAVECSRLLTVAQSDPA